MPGPPPRGPHRWQAGGGRERGSELSPASEAFFSSRPRCVFIKGEDTPARTVCTQEQAFCINPSLGGDPCPGMLACSVPVPCVPRAAWESAHPARPRGLGFCSLLLHIL